VFMSESQFRHDEVYKCDATWQRNYDAGLQESWSNVALVALVPVPFGWLALYALLVLGRWVRAGFMQTP
jgi:hypothetical protein